MRRRSGNPLLTVAEPGRAFAFFGLMAITLTLLLAYVVVEKPGVPAAGWRALFIPSHPANAYDVAVEPTQVYVMAGERTIEYARQMGVELRKSVSNEAHAASSPAP